MTYTDATVDLRSAPAARRGAERRVAVRRYGMQPRERRLRAVLPVGPGTASGGGGTPPPLPATSGLLRTTAGEIPPHPDLRNAR